ncbi:MAG: ACP S-malonyltransferase [Deltaproteobacteria bacterium]|nr:ACP S-malonyltransferase [Deltaproteobacteria bacterium]
MKKVGLVFPGQGSQYVGMGKDFSDRFPAARDVFAEANEALGYDLAALCFQGPEEDLKLTANTQPAILTVSVAALRVMQVERELIPIATAGHSLGEYGALVVSGGLRFADAVRLVHLRGKFMQEAVPIGVGAMAAIMGMTGPEVEALCQEAAQGEVLSPANYNSPGQIAIAGHRSAVNRAVAIVSQRAGKKAVLLPVSAPFHCALLKPAAERLQEELAKVEVGDLHVPVLSNAEADFYPGKDKIRELLIKQIDHPVRWEECMQKLIRAGANLVLEVGPGKVLTGLMRRISKDLGVANVEDGPSWEKAQALLPDE